MSRFTYEIAGAVDDDTREAIYQELRTFNQSANPEWWAARDEAANAPVPLIVICHDESGDVAGGLFGETQFAWLKLSIMAVRADLRGRGVGTELMRRAEAEAARRGCKYAFVDTMSYQAPGFYERLDYQATGRIEDWDSHGHAKLFFTKRL